MLHRKIVPTISDRQRDLLRAMVRSMPRTRHQHGYVEPFGKIEKKWKGHYYVYVREPDGSERRAHRTADLGLRSRFTKGQAEEKLREIIARETRSSVPDPGGVTLAWFWENRFLPMREPTWKESSRREIIANALRYVVRPLGETLLSKIDKFSIQSHLNELAAKYSHSVVEKARVWTRAILEEAVDQDFISKNPARKLVMPVTRKVQKPVVDPAAVASVMAEMPERYRLVVVICAVLGLRPGEALALRWDDLNGHSMRVDEGVVDGTVYTPKTDASVGAVSVPEFIAAALRELRASSPFSADRDFIFANSIGGAFRLDNFRHRVLAPAAERAKVSGVTFQALRRTCATMLASHGTVKDVQAHMRHAQASTSFNVYAQPVAASVSAAVERMSEPFEGVLNTILNTKRTSESKGA